MKGVWLDYKTGEIKIVNTLPPAIKEGGLLIENVYSVISSGTERMVILNAKKNLISKAKNKPEEVKKVVNLMKKEGLFTAYRVAKNKLDTPVPLGYSSAGRVIEVGKGVEGFRVGDEVVCGGSGYALHSEVIFVPKNLCVKLKKKDKLKEGAFTTLGAIGVHGIREVGVESGGSLGIIGLGVIGNLVVGISKVWGYKVVGIDVEGWKLEVAKKMGADLVVNGRESGVVEMVKEVTEGYGVDGVIITASTKDNTPIILAGEIVRDRGKVVLVGVCKVELPRELYYKKEIQFSIARSYGPGRYDYLYEEKGIDYPIGYVRWTEKRNMGAFLDLICEGKLKLNPIITHTFKIEDAKKAYEILLNPKEKQLAIVLEYPPKKEITEKKIDTYGVVQKEEKVKIGFIGGGNFTANYLLPTIKEVGGITLVGIATQTGVKAKVLAEKYGFKYWTTNYKQLLEDREVNTIFITTRNKTHAQFLLESLSYGKRVFCEKPMCVKPEELEEIVKKINQTHLCVFIGFNRRFSPSMELGKEFFQGGSSKFIINYRINNPIEGHWMKEEEEGGVVVSEVCHFVDFIREMVKKKVKEVEGREGGEWIRIEMEFEDGSVGNILYLMKGTHYLPKERVEIFKGNKIMIIEDFRENVLVEDRKRWKKKTKSKGYKEEIKLFLTGGKRLEEEMRKSIETMEIVFKIKESIKKGQRVRIL